MNGIAIARRMRIRRHGCRRKSPFGRKALTREGHDNSDRAQQFPHKSCSPASVLLSSSDSEWLMARAMLPAHGASPVRIVEPRGQGQNARRAPAAPRGQQGELRATRRPLTISDRTRRCWGMLLRRVAEGGHRNKRQGAQSDLATHIPLDRRSPDSVCSVAPFIRAPIETNWRPLSCPAARICGSAWIPRVGSEMPSWRMMIIPGARFFSISHWIYQTGGCPGSCGYAEPSTHV